MRLLWFGCLSIVAGLDKLHVGVLTTWKGGVWDLSHALLGIIPALDKVNQDPNILANYQLEFSWADTQCSTRYASGAAAALLTLGVDVIIGSPCSDDSLKIAPITTFYRVPMVSWYAIHSDLADKTVYPTFVRVVSGMKSYDLTVQAFMQKFGWKHAVLVYPATSSYSVGWAASIRSTFQESSYPIKIQTEVAFTSFGNDQVQTLVNVGARIGLLLTFGCSVMRDVLLTAAANDITEHWLWVADTVSSSCWNQNDGKDAESKLSFIGLYFVLLHYQVDAEDVKMMQDRRNEMSPHITPENPDGAHTYSLADMTPSTIEGGLIHDAILLFAYGLNALLSDGGDRRNITLMTQYLMRTSFQGLTGKVELDKMGNRKGDVHVLVLKPDDTGDGLEQQHVATYNGIAESCDLLVPKASLIWPGGLTAIPRDRRIMCESGEFLPLGAEQCEKCPKGRYSATREFDRSSCTACEPDTYADSEGQLICFPCVREGGTSAAAAVSCDLCKPGYSTPANGQTGCIACKPGEFSDAISQSTCQRCPVGRFNGERAAAICQACQPGTYAASEGSMQCDLCSPGTYSDAQKQSNCQVCAPESSTGPSLWMTLHKIDSVKELVPLEGAKDRNACGCRPGTRPESGDCTTCGEGLICRGKNLIDLEKGYFSFANDVSDVWRCFGGAGRCPGGPPETCAKNRDVTTVGCAACMAGYRPGDTGACDRCGSIDYFPIILTFMATVACLSALYYFISKNRRATQNHSMLTVAFASSQVMTFCQQLGIMENIDIAFPQPFSAVLDVVSLLNFDIRVLNVGCVVDTGPVLRFVFRVFLVFWVFVLVLVIHAVAVFAFHAGQFRKMNTVLIGSTGTIFMVFLLSVVSSLCTPLNCQPHPNGESTMRSESSVVCWTDRFDSPHGPMVAIGVIACLVPLAFVSVAVNAVYQLPGKMREGDAEFLQVYSFLFVRFQTGCHWYVLVFIFRNLVLALAPSIPNAGVQIILLVLVLLLSLTSTACVLPWRVFTANVLDIVFHCGVILLLALSGFYTDNVDPKMLGTFSVVVFALVLGAAIFSIFGAFYDRFLKSGKAYQYFICHHKGGAGNFARLLKMHLLESSAVRRNVFLDSDDLQDLTLLFGIVQGHLDTLVVACSKEILFRPWCVGEIVTAQLNKVPVVRVDLSDFVPPNSEFCELYGLHVPEIAQLAEFGIDLTAVQNALRWFGTIKSIYFSSASVPCDITAKISFMIVNSKVGDVKKLETNRCQTAKFEGCEAAILVDNSNFEAKCAAYVLKKMLTEFMPSEVAKIPTIIDEYSALAAPVDQVLLICSNGVFQRGEIILNMIVAGALNVAMIPVVSEPAFRFPTKSSNRDLLPYFNNVVSSANHPCTEAAFLELLEGTFMEIACDFNPQESQTVLITRASTIYSRLTGKTTRMSGKTSVSLSRSQSSLHGHVYMADSVIEI